MEPSPDDRPPLVRAMEWSSRVTTISLEMAIPGLIGLWIDRKLGTKMLFLVAGVILGFCTGMWHLLKLTASSSNENQTRPKADE